MPASAGGVAGRVPDVEHPTATALYQGYMVAASLLVGLYWYLRRPGSAFGALLIAFGVLHGDMQFMLFPLPIQIKAKYLVTVYLLIAFASFFLSDKIYALAQLGGALCGFIYVKSAPRRGFFSGTATTSGSAAAPRASSRSTCASRTARFTSIAKAVTSIPTKAKTPTTSAG